MTRYLTRYLGDSYYQASLRSSKLKLVMLFLFALAAGKLSGLIPEKCSGLYGVNFAH